MPSTTLRHKFWRATSRLHRRHTRPWTWRLTVLAGDLNENRWPFYRLTD